MNFNKIALFVVIFFIMVDSNCISQEIDPRQYLNVTFKSVRNSSKIDTIWNWESDLRIPNQKIILLDIEGEIKINFLKDSFITNHDFEGTVSLEAEISGVNGTRKIEVNPYSEIGVQRIPIGIKSDPPFEIAKRLLNMIKELRNAEAMYNEVRFTLNTPTDKEKDNQFREKTKYLLSKVSKEPFSEELLSDAKDIEYFFYNSKDSASYFFQNVKTTRDLKNGLERMVSAYEEYINSYNSGTVKRIKPAFKYALGKTTIVLDYLTSFEESGEDAIKAFFALLNIDLVNYKSIKNNFVFYQKQLNQIVQSFPEGDSRFDSLLITKQEFIKEACESLTTLTRFEGSTLEEILKDIAKYRGGLDTAEDEDKTSIRNATRRMAYFEFIDKNIHEISDRLSKEAGRTIFKKLIYASIDLGKSGAKNGEVINLYLVWILNSRRDSLSNSPRLTIGKYYLNETAWKFEVADMFALIKRVNEDEVDQSKVSPSNFKGSGGAVLMWTYLSQDKGIRIKKNQNNIIIKKKNKLLNLFEPSIGINVSYLDFDTEKDVEIGTGLQFGLFRNKLFFGYGVNLHLLSPKNQSPNYYYVGFSFAKLSDLFRDSPIISALR